MIVFRWPRLLRWGLISVVLTLGVLLGVRLGFDSIDRPYEGYERFVQRSFLLEPAPWKVLPVPPPVASAPVPGGSALDRIRARGVLRVGYAPDRLPSNFQNDAGELVGLDVELMHVLARDFGVSLEFVRTSQSRLAPLEELLNRGQVDLAIGGWSITPDRLERMTFSAPYLEETFGFVVQDHLRDEFQSLATIRELGPLRFGAPGRGYYLEKTRQLFPSAEVVEISSPRVFFSGQVEALDALVLSAEAGSAWTLIYPQFTVAVPKPNPLRAPVGFPVADGDHKMRDFLSGWILLKQKDGTIERLFNYWIEGQEPKGQQRRWSVARDVLGWLDDD